MKEEYKIYQEVCIHKNIDRIRLYGFINILSKISDPKLIEKILYNEDNETLLSLSNIVQKEAGVAKKIEDYRFKEENQNDSYMWCEVEGCDPEGREKTDYEKKLKMLSLLINQVYRKKNGSSKSFTSLTVIISELCH